MASSHTDRTKEQKTNRVVDSNQGDGDWYVRSVVRPVDHCGEVQLLLLQPAANDNMCVCAVMTIVW